MLPGFLIPAQRDLVSGASLDALPCPMRNSLLGRSLKIANGKQLLQL